MLSRTWGANCQTLVNETLNKILSWTVLPICCISLSPSCRMSRDIPLMCCEQADGKASRVSFGTGDVKPDFLH